MCSCSTNLGQFFHIGTWDKLIFVSVFEAESHCTALLSLELKDLPGCVSRGCVTPTMAQNKLSPIPFEVGVVLWVHHTSVFIPKCLYLFRKTRRANDNGRWWPWLRLTPLNPATPPFWDVKWDSHWELSLHYYIIILISYHFLNLFQTMPQ